MNNLAQLRKQKKLSQVELGKILGVAHRNAKKLSPENRKKLLDVAKAMFGEEFDE